MILSSIYYLLTYKSLSQVVKEMEEGIDAFLPCGQVQMFVWRMDVVTRQTHTHENRFNAANLLEHRHCADGAAFTTIQRTFAPDGFHGRVHGFDAGIVQVRDRRGAARQSFHFPANSHWC